MVSDVDSVVAELLVIKGCTGRVGGSGECERIRARREGA